MYFHSLLKIYGVFLLSRQVVQFMNSVLYFRIRNRWAYFSNWSIWQIPIHLFSSVWSECHSDGFFRPRHQVSYIWCGLLVQHTLWAPWKHFSRKLAQPFSPILAGWVKPNLWSVSHFQCQLYWGYWKAIWKYQPDFMHQLGICSGAIYSNTIWAQTIYILQHKAEINKILDLLFKSHLEHSDCKVF